jgi:hypothetical protein
MKDEREIDDEGFVETKEANVVWRSSRSGRAVRGV